MNTFHIKSQTLVTTILQLERSGKYEQALVELDDIWKDKSGLPNVEEFDKKTAAEIIARCGSLIGLLGNLNLTPSAQEISKNLLTEAYTRFQELIDFEKIAECENYLALAYLRGGEVNEAESWLELSLSHILPDSNDIRLFAHITKSLVLFNKNQYDEIIQYLEPLETSFREYGDSFLIGSLYCNLGLAFKRIGKYSEALKYLELARGYHKESDHMIYLGTVENNIASVYIAEQKFTEAHDAIDKAIKTFRGINDLTRYGFSYDTKALLYLNECKYEKGLDEVEKGILILKRTENTEYLLETYKTKIKLLLHLDKNSEAVRCLTKAVFVAETKIGEYKVQEIIEEYENTRSSKNTPTFKNIYIEKALLDEDIELVLPDELSHYTDIEGVWIKNKNLETTGLIRNSMAIVANVEFTKGDLIAVVERDSDAVSCGYYDSDFGIVCLNRFDSEPLLFNEEDIRVLGKIVGVANKDDDDDDNKMYATSIEVSR